MAKPKTPTATGTAKTRASLRRALSGIMTGVTITSRTGMDRDGVAIVVSTVTWEEGSVPTAAVGERMKADGALAANVTAYGATITWKQD